MQPAADPDGVHTGDDACVQAGEGREPSALASPRLGRRGRGNRRGLADDVAWQLRHRGERDPMGRRSRGRCSSRRELVMRARGGWILGFVAFGAVVSCLGERPTPPATVARNQREGKLLT